MARELLAEAADSDLMRPYVDREKDHSVNSVGAAALHFIEGYQKIGRLLKTAGCVPAAEGTPHTHGHGHAHDHAPRLPEVLEKLDGTQKVLPLLADLTDTQLDSVPAVKNQWADGERTLAVVLDTIISHQAGHLASLRDALV
ncbi:hypothetical protein E2651_03700 [Streptomyces sp. MZ04]|nr:hypothetical protein E2651_03700 [Streptomyces sp. MZ04]